MTALVELKSVTNKFGAQLVHDRVNLTLEENEILGLVGGSGSGKSVLLRTILGLNRPKSGKVLIEGENLLTLSREKRREVEKKWGVLFQNGALFSGLTVLDNVAMPLREHTDLGPQSIATLASLKLQMAGLEPEAADKYPAALSGGMVTRAALARAMALDPRILFLDEPTGALDPVAASALDDLMISLRDILKLSILVISHDVNTLAKVCDRIAVIADKKVEVGTFDDLARSSTPGVKKYFDNPRVKAALRTRGKRT